MKKKRNKKADNSHVQAGPGRQNSRSRFLDTLSGGRPDHPPLFPEGIRDDVLQAWRQQGLSRGTELEDIFHYDRFEELDPEIEPLPAIQDWSDRKALLRELRRRLDPDDPRRYTKNWAEAAHLYKERDFPLFLRIHEGLFLSLGVDGWQRFSEALLLLVDEPEFVREVLEIRANFTSRLLENILREIQVDAVILSEPIAGNQGPLVSPRMYRDLMTASFESIFAVMARFQVPISIWRSFANPKALLPEVVKAGFDALWICETPPGGVDYSELRRELGPEIGLMGGIDTDLLRESPARIQQAVEAVLPLVSAGRYIPMADGRVREVISFHNYATYRRTFEQMIGNFP